MVKLSRRAGAGVPHHRVPQHRARHRVTIIDLDTCVNTRTVPGGPSEAYIKSLIELNKKCIENLK